MVLAGVQWLSAMSPLAVMVAVVWAVWFVALQSIWTAGTVLAAYLVASSWGWSGGQTLDLCVGVLLTGYVIDCLLDPRADCWWCHGSPKRRNDRGFFHLCWICKGSGQRKRWGSQVLGRHRPAGSDVT